jgi:hypothetical protein
MEGAKRTQDAMCDLIKWKRGLFGRDRPVSQLQDVLRRYRVAMRQHLQHTPCQLQSYLHNPNHCLDVTILHYTFLEPLRRVPKVWRERPSCGRK